MPTKTRSLLGLAACLLCGQGLVHGQSYHNLAASNFSENFADIASTATWPNPTKAGGSWSGFAATTTSPASGLPDPTKTTTSSATFSTSSSGGIQRGSGQSPAAENLVFLSTGTTDNTTSVGLDLLLNFSGRVAGSVSFDAAELNNSFATGNNRQGTLHVYASGDDGGSWTELTGADLPFIVTNGVAKSASISVSLPSGLGDKPKARLRFYYRNGTGGTAGSRPKITIDNVLVTSTPAAVDAPVITSELTGSVMAGASYNYTITASGSPTSFTATGLPAGLSVDGVTGVISGTPTFPGTYNITIGATNGTGTGSALLVLTVTVNENAPVVSDGTTTGTVGQSFSYQIVATNSPASYSVGALPSGLSLDTTTGIISGVPTVGGVFSDIAIGASNSFGSDQGVLSITIASAPVLTGTFSGSVYLGGAFAYTITYVQNPTYINVTGLPDGVTFDGVNKLEGTPTAAGSYNISIVAGNTLGTDTKTFVLKVVEPSAQSAIPTNVVINKYVNGTPDKVELLVVGNGAPGSTVDMRGMILKDFSSNMDNDGGGKYEFAANSLWSAVPAGTLVVLSLGSSEAEDLNAADFVLRVNLGNATFFNNLGGTFDIATTDVLLIKPAGYGALGVAGGIHALAGGVAGAQFTAFTGAKLIAAGTSGTNLGVMAKSTTSTLADYNGTDATGAVALASLSFGAANNATNQTYIDSLRSAPLSAVQTWRQTYFGTTANSGDAADSFDYDGDGIPNLLEYATGTNPTAANAGVVTLAKSGDFLTLSFPVISDTSVTYTVQASDDLASFATATGSVSTTGGVSTYTDNVSLSTAGVRRFLRLQVSHTE